MRLVFLIVMVLGVGLAGFAVYTARNYFAQKQAEVDAANQAIAAVVPTEQIYIVNRALKYGDRITLEDVRLIPYPQPALPEGVFRKPEDLFPGDGEKFRTVLRAMEANEALLAIKVSEQGADAGVSARLGANMRAFAISVDVASGVSGFLRPGDKVDIYWSGEGIPDANGNGGGRITRLIDTNIKLIAVDQTADSDSGEGNVARTVTVEVTPQQVTLLVQAQSTGSLTLSLVGADDTSTASAEEVDQRKLLGVPDAPAPVKEEVKAPEEACAVKTRKAGTTAEELAVECNN